MVNDQRGVEDPRAESTHVKERHGNEYPHMYVP